MSLLKYAALTLFLFLSLGSTAQNKRFVEEVALYHLDSLNRTSPDFKLVQYYTKGFLIASTTSIKDTVEDHSVKKNLQMKSVFKDLAIVEKAKLSSFPFSEHPKKNKNYTPLNIYHYMKLNNQYFVFFDIQGTFSGTNLLLVMDLNGNLLRYKITTYKN